MNDRFAAIPVFVAVVECESFSAAAERLGITKSAVSKRITQLERSLGVQLLQRTTRSLSLTEAGEQYFGYARNACAVAQEG
ncbi:HTH-type transcriptional activator AllS [compost metagenome]